MPDFDVVIRGQSLIGRQTQLTAGFPLGATPIRQAMFCDQPRCDLSDARAIALAARRNGADHRVTPKKAGS